MAATSILRLQVDNKQFDDTLKDSVKGLNTLCASFRKYGQDMSTATKSEIEYVRAMGQMETTSTSAKGRLAELKKALKELRYQYQEMSASERKSPIGKAMAESIQNLKPRVEDARKEVEKLKKETKDINSSAVEDLAKKYISLQAAIGLVKGAFNVLKEAVTSSEEGLDDYNRTVAKTEAVYNQLLITLGGGEWSNFFTNIKEAIARAGELYDKLDALQSIKTNNQAAIAIDNASLAKMRAELQKASNAGDKAEVERLKKEIEKVQAHIHQLQQSDVNAGKEYGFSAVASAIKAQGGQNISDGMASVLAKKVIEQGDAYVRQMEAEFKRLRDKYSVTTKTANGGRDWETTVDTKSMTKAERNQYYKAMAVYNAESQMSEGIQAYAQAAQAEQSAYMQEFKVGRWGKEGSARTSSKSNIAPSSEYKALPTITGAREQWMKEVLAQQDVFAKQVAEEMKEVFSQNNLSEMISTIRQQVADSDIGGPFYEKLTEKLSDAENLKMLLEEAVRNGVDTAELSSLYDKLLGDEAISNTDWDNIAAKINEQLKALGIEPIKLKFDATGKASKDVKKDAKETSDAWLNAANSVQRMGAALAGVEDPATKIAGTIMQAIAGVAAGFGNAAKGPFATPWEYIAFIASGMASMLTAVTTIKSVTSSGEHKAGGGFVSGTPTGGPWGIDTVPIMASAGELILNRSQQENLSQSLQSSANDNRNAAGLGVVVRGDKMFTVLDNYMRTTNKRFIR